MQKIPKKPTKGKADWSNLTANLGLSPAKKEKVLQITGTHMSKGTQLKEGDSPLGLSPVNGKSFTNDGDTHK